MLRGFPRHKKQHAGKAGGQWSKVGVSEPTLYSLAISDPSVYHDVTSGCSLLKPSYSAPMIKTGYCASAGWDFVTGWGSIDAAKLASHLAPSAHVVPGFPFGAPVVLSIILAEVLFAVKRRMKAKSN